MGAHRNPIYLIGSVLFHALILLALVLGFEFSSPPVVIQNTNKNDVISAVILGESPESKILPIAPPPVIKPIETPTPPAKQKPTPAPEVKPDIIAIKSDVEKKLLEHKPQADKIKKQRNLLTNDLLADIKKHSKNQKAVHQKQLKSHFEKTLKVQAEKSMRQLLDEDVMLEGKENRQSQGEVKKHVALIKQVIGNMWIVPTQSNRKLRCVLKIRLAPGGLVLDVQITKTSGDPALDSSARAAVLKASPLPVPKDKAAFEQFREFELVAKPKDIVTSNVGT